MKKSLYFTHDYNALSDKKIKNLRRIYGMEGYGIYWGIVEALCREPDFKLPYSRITADELSSNMYTTLDMLKFIDECINIGLFVKDGEKFWSESLMKRMVPQKELSDKRRAAARKRWEKHIEVESNPVEPPKPVEKPKPVEQQKKDGAMPTPEELDAYVDGLDPEWRKVVKAYETNIGLIPTGKAMDLLLSFYEDIGADAMIVAIEATNENQASKPFSYLKSILNTFAEKGVHTAQQAKAEMKDHERERKQWASFKQQKKQMKQPEEEEIRWFYG